MSAGFLSVILFSGCAGTTFHRVKNDREDHGIRFPEYSTYLLVATDNDGGITSQLMQLPDNSRLMSARPWAFMSTNESKMTFTDGVLTSSESTLDTTKVASAVADVVKTVGPLLLAASDPKSNSTPNGTVPRPRLFKLVQTGDEVSFVEAEADLADVKFKS